MPFSCVDQKCYILRPLLSRPKIQVGKSKPLLHSIASNAEGKKFDALKRKLSLLLVRHSIFIKQKSQQAGFLLILEYSTEQCTTSYNEWRYFCVLLCMYCTVGMHVREKGPLDIPEMRSLE